MLANHFVGPLKFIVWFIHRQSYRITYTYAATENYNSRSAVHLSLLEGESDHDE